MSSIDAAYLYRCGHWGDVETRNRESRVGSVAFDYVGKAFADGGLAASCLLVKFATKPGKKDDDSKWYVYPTITDDGDIWDILTYAITEVQVSVGRGFHVKMHPLLETSPFLHIGPPNTRTYDCFRPYKISSFSVYSVWRPLRSLAGYIGPGASCQNFTVNVGQQGGLGLYALYYVLFQNRYDPYRLSYRTSAWLMDHFNGEGWWLGQNKSHTVGLWCQWYSFYERSHFSRAVIGSDSRLCSYVCVWIYAGGLPIMGSGGDRFFYLPDFTAYSDWRG